MTKAAAYSVSSSIMACFMSSRFCSMSSFGIGYLPWRYWWYCSVRQLPVANDTRQTGQRPPRETKGEITLRPFSYAWLYTLEVMLVEALLETSNTDGANSSSSARSSSAAASMGGGCSPGANILDSAIVVQSHTGTTNGEALDAERREDRCGVRRSCKLVVCMYHPGSVL